MAISDIKTLEEAVTILDDEALKMYVDKLSADYSEELIESVCALDIEKRDKILSLMPIRMASNIERDIEEKNENQGCSDGVDPIYRFESLIKTTSKEALKKLIDTIDDSDLSVSSYYLNDNDKGILFDVIGEEKAGVIREDQQFMGNPSRRDVREACIAIMDAVDKNSEEK